MKKIKSLPDNIDHDAVDECAKCGKKFIHPDHRIRVERPDRTMSVVCSFMCGLKLRKKDNK